MSTKSKSVREVAQGNRNIWNLPPNVLKEKSGWNVRDDTAELRDHIESIAQSIIFGGYDASKPITAYQDGADYIVTDGHCRRLAVLRAIELGAPIKTVPVVLETRGVNEEARVAGMLTRNAGKPLTVLEIGRVYLRLQAFGWTDEQIAGTTGKPVASVRAVFATMEADPSNHRQIVNGEVSAGVVGKTVQKHGPAKAKKILDKAVKASSGKRATARDVKAAENGEVAVKPMALSELLEFFSATIRDNDGPPIAIVFAGLVLALRERRLTPEKFMDRVSELQAKELVES